MDNPGRVYIFQTCTSTRTHVRVKHRWYEGNKEGDCAGGVNVDCTRVVGVGTRCWYIEVLVRGTVIGLTAEYLVRVELYLICVELVSGQQCVQVLTWERSDVINVECMSAIKTKTVATVLW